MSPLPAKAPTEPPSLVIAEQAAVVEETLSILRHDVRNKLAAARQAGFYLQTKSRGSEAWNSDPRVERFFGVIDEQLGVAETMLVEHESLSRIYTRRPRTLDAAVPLQQTAHAAQLPERSSVVVEVAATACIVADDAELVLALRCLVDNAAQAMPEGGLIRMRGDVTPPDYVFAVIDRGPGLSEDDFRKLARPFATTRPGARGLGLSIAKRIASRYGGAVKLGRVGEGGARLELSIPLAAKAAP